MPPSTRGLIPRLPFPAAQPVIDFYENTSQYDLDAWSEWRGAYSLTRVPGHPDPCVKVVFPLPNGNAIVVMKATVAPDGAFTLHDAKGLAHARYVPSMKESIHVYAAEPGIVRADHHLKIWGFHFLRLHYRMRRRAA